MQKKQVISVQDWLPFEKILENGIIKLKDNSYVKIMKITPVNFNLKSSLEKEAILNSYKIFLQTIEVNIQILIQSNKENLLGHISNIKNHEEKNKKIINLSNKYINFIQKINSENKSSSKNYFIIIKDLQGKNENSEKISINNLNTNYFKIKECLYRCGNIVNEINNKKETEEIIKSFIKG